MLDTENNFRHFGSYCFARKEGVGGVGGPIPRCCTGSCMARTKEKESAVSLVPTSDITVLIISAVVYVA